MLGGRSGTLGGVSSRRGWWVVWLVASLPLVGWWLTGLFDLDEGFYGAVTAEMNRRGEWITPFFNGKPWFEKPILIYWVSKPALMLFGDVWGPRIPSVLATLGIYGIVVWFCRRRLSDAAAAWSILILGGSLLFSAAERLMMTDPLLNLCLVAALLLFWESLVGDRRWRLASAALVGFGVHAKGPVAIILFGLVVVWTFAREPEMRPAFKGWWLLGTALLLGVVALWYVPAYLVNGHDFVQQFLIEQNLNRFTGGDKAHTLGGPASLALFIPILLLGMAPWSFYLLKAWPRRTPDGSPEAPLRRFLAAWVALVFIFFSISGAKLPHYVLPCCVPMAILVGDWLARRQSAVQPLTLRDLRWPLAWTTFVAVLLNVGLLIYYNWFHAEIHGLTRYVREHRLPGEEVAVYRMPRQQADKGTGKLQIQETSHPSILLYLDSTVVDTKKLSDLLEVRRPLWILTRPNRISVADVEAANADGEDLVKVDTPVPEHYYALWRLTVRKGR